MNLKLDHFFILTERPKEAGDLLTSLGFKESFSRDHKGQGTSNRRFEFANGMLELLYVRDSAEAENGPAKGLRFTDRTLDGNSPFGLILIRTNDTESTPPFCGWTYQPDYFPPPKSFHIGNNANNLLEPLCIYAPFISPTRKEQETALLKAISQVIFTVPVKKVSETIKALETTERVVIELGNEHLVKMILDNGKGGHYKDLRPILPLIIKW